MITNEYIEKYENEIVGACTDTWMQEILKIVFNENNSVIETIKNKLGEFMDRIAKMQKIQPIAVGLITISFMRTGAFEGKPCIRLDAYDKNREIGINIAYSYIDADWFLESWKRYKKSLEDNVNEKGLSRYIKSARINQTMSKGLSRFIDIFMIGLKYDFMDIPVHDQMLKEEVFVVSVGEYLDKQRVLFAHVPDFDLVADKSRKATFAVFEKVVYRRQEWKDGDWERVKFIGCEFSECIFENMNMKDAIFVNCLFKNSKIQNTDMSGARFEQCTFSDVIMDQVTMHCSDKDDAMKINDFYRQVLFIDCVNNNETMSVEGDENWNIFY